MMTDPRLVPPRRPSDEDIGERVNRLRIIGLAVGSCIVFSAALAVFLHETRGTGPLAMLGIVLLGAALGYGVGRAAWHAGDLTGRAFAHQVLAAGNLPPAPSFSYQESLVARGRLAEAVEAYETHLAAHPADLDARLALAALLAGPLRDAPGAERIYLEARARSPAPRYERAIGNALIDLYHATGQRGRELAELARLASRFRGTLEGDRARDALIRIKAEGA
jgi:hypothetical protein